MKNSRTLALFGMIACCGFLASVRTNAQSVTGFTDLSYDDLTNAVIAYSETDTDYDVGGDYTAYVNLVVRDDNLNIVASGTHLDGEGFGYASVTLQFFGSPDTTYIATGTHRLNAFFYYDYWDYDDYPYRRVTYYYDNWYFGYFSGMGIEYPWYYYFSSPGYAFRTRTSRLIFLGTTHSFDSATTPGVSISITPSQTVKDGETASLSVTVTGDTPSAYKWGFSSPRGAANSPQVSFSAATSASTDVTAAHWFANPNSPCGASFNAPYTISCAITLSNGKKKTVKTTLTVNAFWSPAGDTPNPTITGGPTIAFNTASNLWVVVNSGSLARGTPSATIYIPSSSQFYNKTVTHENRHVTQWSSGMLSDLLLVASLMTQLSPLTDATQAGLMTKINNASLSWFNSQEAIYNSRLPAAEKDAYNVSDPIAPQYLYQNCGRY
jgi:hypothetical protein